MFAQRGRLGPDDDAPVSAGGRNCRATQPAHQRMARTRRQSQPPSDEVPDDSGEQAAQDGGNGYIIRINQSLADGDGDSRADEGPEELEDGGKSDALVDGENFGGNDGGDGIGRIV